ncbi:Ribose-phosphate pyrophosphokinase 2, partial [Perkinsus olseni]
MHLLPRFDEYTDQRKMPIVFCHGIGLGLLPYIPVVHDIVRRFPDRDIFCVDMPHIACRPFVNLPSAREMSACVIDMLRAWRYSHCHVIGHSFGCILSRWILAYQPSIVRSLSLVDPVNFLLVKSDLLHNALKIDHSDPFGALATYFSLRELYTVHTFCRNFFWEENIIWPEDLRDVPTHITLCGNDFIAPAHSTRNLLGVEKLERAEIAEINGESAAERFAPLSVYWIPDGVHAEILFYGSSRREVLSRVEQLVSDSDEWPWVPKASRTASVVSKFIRTGYGSGVAGNSYGSSMAGGEAEVELYSWIRDFSSFMAPNPSREEHASATADNESGPPRPQEQPLRPQADDEPESEETEEYYVDPGKHKYMKVFACSDSEQLASEICANLGTTKGRAYTGKFADGEVIVNILDEVRGQDCFIIQQFPISKKSGVSRSKCLHDAIMESYLMISALRRASARTITLITPYFAYARHMESEGVAGDPAMTQPATPLAASDIALMYEAMGVDRVVTVDLHEGSLEG